MTLYRAAYISASARLRRLTFARPGGPEGARVFALHMRLAGERLVDLRAVRSRASPQGELFP